MNTVTTLPLDQAQAGMRLAQDIRDPGGNLLAAAGIALDADIIRSLARRGIENVHVAMEHEDAIVPNAPPGEEMEQRLAHLFRRARQTATGEALYRAVLEYRLGNPR